MRLILVATFALTACVGARQPLAFPIEYAAKDMPKEEKIYVVYKNTSAKDICLYPTNWPNGQGEVESGKDRVFIRTENSSYTTIDFDTGYCPGCTLRVLPGHEATSFFKYSDFTLPRAEFEKAKTLIFSPMANYCPPKR